MKRIPVAELAQNVFKLPRLPIPSLDGTFDRYRESIKPLKAGDALNTHIQKLDTFLQSSAPVLQKQLLDTDEAAIKAGTYPFSYVEALLDNTTLSSRVPLEVNMNTSFVLKKEIAGTDGTQVGVAAGIVHEVARLIKDMIVSGLTVDDTRFDISPLLGEFGRSLIPSKEKDEIFNRPLKDLRHIVVLHDGHPYLVRIFDDHQNVLDRAHIQKALELIISITPDQDNTTPVAVLTAGNRALWGEAYQELMKTPENAKALSLFHEAVLVVCLDSKGWGDDDNLAEASALHGSSEELENRWYDKHQLIVSADGQVAFNFEPTVSDRIHWARWISDVLGRLASENMGKIDTSGIDAVTITKMMQQIKVTFGKSFAGHIRTARQEAQVLVEGTEVHSVRLPYGRDALAALNVDPDAFVQMCLQCAQYQLRDRLSATSQLCSTARFFRGTTEVVRSTTTEALELAECVAVCRKAAAVSAATAAGTATPEAVAAAAAAAKEGPVISTENKERMEKLARAACDRHTQLVQYARTGKGIDRHLMALHNVAKINGDKAGLAFFEDELYKLSRTFFLNTCEFSSPWLRYYTFGPAFSNGYGLGYVVDASEIRISLSGFTNRPATNVADLKIAVTASAETVFHMLSGN